MRNIVFRGKCLSNGKWAHGDLIQYADVGCQIHIDKDKRRAWIHPKTVGQFIGLLDINDKCIYEGDVLHNGSRNYRVAYLDGSFQTINAHGLPLLRLDAFVIKESCFEIVGNIHDNPKLLNENGN